MQTVVDRPQRSTINARLPSVMTWSFRKYFPLEILQNFTRLKNNPKLMQRPSLQVSGLLAGWLTANMIVATESHNTFMPQNTNNKIRATEYTHLQLINALAAISLLINGNYSST